MIQLQFLNKLLVEKNPALLTLNNIDESFFSEYSDEYNYIKSHLELYGRIPDVATFLNEFPDFDIIKVDDKNIFEYETLLTNPKKSILLINQYLILCSFNFCLINFELNFSSYRILINVILCSLHKLSFNLS